jgi:hypothetical protein
MEAIRAHFDGLISKSMPRRPLPVWSQLISEKEIHMAERTDRAHMEAGTSLRYGTGTLYMVGSEPLRFSIDKGFGRSSR